MPGGAMIELNETHDPALRSWVASANDKACDFPIQNLPFAVFRHPTSDPLDRIGVAIGDQVVDLSALVRGASEQPDSRNPLDAVAPEVVDACAGSTLNRLMALDAMHRSSLRLALSRMLRQGAAPDDVVRCLVPMADIEYGLPASIGDYTDFYTSIHHATSVGRQFRPDNPLLPNYRWVPIAYHGRSSSIGVSGQSFPRPWGQRRPPEAQAPFLAPAERVDFELEVGIFIGPGNEAGQPVAMDAAESHVFGLCLFNDWSARDIQAWEYQPLGPFLAKNFASTISPWVVTMEALAPFRLAWHRPVEDPQPLAYLDGPMNRNHGAIDLNLEVCLTTRDMQRAGLAPVGLARTNFRHSYWTVAQMVAHHTVNGCNLSPGDLFGSGTQSGPEPSEAGSLLELSDGGRSPITLPDGQVRTFVEDGDTVIMRGWCERPGAVRIGFGEVASTLLPAVPHPALEST